MKGSRLGQIGLAIASGVPSVSLSHANAHSLTHTQHLFFLILVGDAHIVTAELFVGRCEEPT